MKILSSALVLFTSFSKINVGLSQIPDHDLVQITSDGKDSGGTAISTSSALLQLVETMRDDAAGASDTDTTPPPVADLKTRDVGEDRTFEMLSLMLEGSDVSNETKETLRNIPITDLLKVEGIDSIFSFGVSVALDNSSLSEEVKNALRNTIGRDSLLILSALATPGTVISGNSSPPGDDDLNTEDVNLGWAKSRGFWCWSPWGCDDEWASVSFSTVTQVVSERFTIEMAVVDDLTEERYSSFPGSVITSNVAFPREDIHDDVDQDTLRQIMNELRLEGEGGALPVSYNSDFDVLADESFTRVFFYGLGSVLIAKQNEVSNNGSSPFELDMPLDELEVREGYRSYGARVHFSHDQQVTAIFDYGEDKLTQPGEAGWNEAKLLALVTMTTLVTAREHLTWSHFLCANNAALNTARHLPPDHPIRRLLTPFTFHTNEVNAAAFDSLIPENSFLHRSTAFEYSTLVEVFESSFRSSNIFEPFPDRQYNPALTGLIEEGKFPHVNESVDNYNAIRNFVRSWLQEAGDAASDAHAINFFNAMRESTMGQEYEIPTFDDSTMANVLTSIIFTVTCYHELVGHVVDYKDLSLRITNDGVLDLQSRLYWNIIVATTSTRMPMLMSPFENYFSAGGAPAWERVAFDAFKVELAGLSEMVQEADAQREVEFKYCDPARFECSISV